MAALTLPFILNFASGEAAPEVNQPFETSETAPPADVEVVDENSKVKENVEAPKVEQPAETPKVEQSAETPKVEQSAETPKVRDS